MKAPVDPSEPMFPVRPNEPVCQYYMKHGTCKFGQACKFHHPPQSSVTAALVGGGTVVMNVGRKSDVPQIVVNSLSGDGSTNGTPMMLQFLPQRPEEQDCIFFLKNGRCKYGATCRYHHPINFNHRRDDIRRQRVQIQQIPDGYLQHSNVQFISQAGNHHISYQQGASGGSHMVVSEGPVAYMAVDGSAGKGAYHSVSVVSSNDGYCAPTGAPISHNQDHTSSTSSIASSYDTANSNVDHLVPHTEQQSCGLWNRQKNNGSHASLNAYDTSNGRQQMGTRMTMPQSNSDGSIASRQRHRAASYGSASDSGVFVDATGLGRASSGGGMPSNGTVAAAPAWRSERNPSFEGARRIASNQYRSRGDLSSGSHHNHYGRHEEPGPGEQHQAHLSITVGTPGAARRIAAPGGQRRSSQAVDDGLNMMTSALLTMLDTPEEAAAEGFEYGREDSTYCSGAVQRSLGVPMSAALNEGMPARSNDINSVVSRVTSDGLPYTNDGQIDCSIFSGLAMSSSVVESHYQDSRSMGGEEKGTWLPSWQASKSVGSPFEGESQSIAAIQSQHSGPISPHNSSDVGLFLP